MKLVSVGLSDLSVYVPRPRISLSGLAARRIQENPDLEKHLSRALASTGQISMRFPQVWEDPITMASEALRKLLKERLKDHLSGIRFLALGSETSVDMSKSGSNYVLGLLQKAGFKFPSSLSSFQLQHACAGGSLAALTTLAYLQAAGNPGESSVVLTSDIARYAAPSTAEVTQGAGACALWLTQEPQVLDFDLKSAGFFSQDVDDFFRPLGSTIAKVRGGFSLSCYNESLLLAFLDHCSRAGTEPATELRSIDIFALHVPYAKMPLGALEKLFALHLGFDASKTREHLEERGFFASLKPASEIGNLYTGSLWLSLGYSLKERWQKMGADIVGRKVLMASYGSGNTMAVWTGQIAPQAPSVIANWDFEELLKEEQEVEWETYLDWLSIEKNSQNYPELLKKNPAPAGAFHLARLREDGYREYDQA
jgi:hydroxymethylglutaryl-CoA synthase